MNVTVSNVPEENKKLRAVKTLVVMLILAFYGTLLVHKIELPFADDIARHIKNGELIMHGDFSVLYSNVYSYTEPDFPFVNHHWLSGVVFYLVHQALGWNGLVIFKTIVLLSAFALLFLAALKKADFWLVAACSVPAILILSERTALRPEIFSYFIVSLYLYMLTGLEEHPERKRIFWLIPLQLLWVNLHIFFIVGPMLVGGLLLEKIILHWSKLTSNLLVRRLAIFLLALVLVSFINPNGWKGTLQPLQIFTHYGFSVGENQSITEFFRGASRGKDISADIFFPVASLLMLSFILAWRKKPLFYFLASVATAITGFLIIRTLAFFGLIFLPAISANLDSLFCVAKERLKQRWPSIEGIFGKICILAFICTLSFVVMRSGQGKFSEYKKPGFGLTPHAEDSANFFRENNLKGPIFNDYDSGSYLIYNLFPEERVFTDNRPEAYSLSFFNDTYFPVLESEDAWQNISQKYNFNVIFVYQYDQGWFMRSFLWRRLRDTGWSLVYADRYNVIFVRNIPENEEVIQKFRIASENLEEKMAPMLHSPDFEDQVAAADIFTLFGREDLGETVFLRVVSEWPDRGKIWMMLGEIELRKKTLKGSQLGLLYLDKAIARGWNTSEAYSYLGAAHLNLGELKEARDALLRSLKIYPDRQNAKDLWGLLEKRTEASMPKTP